MQSQCNISILQYLVLERCKRWKSRVTSSTTRVEHLQMEETSLPSSQLTAEHQMTQSDTSATAGSVTLHGSKITMHSETTACSLSLPHAICPVLPFVGTGEDNQETTTWMQWKGDTNLQILRNRVPHSPARKTINK